MRTEKIDLYKYFNLTRPEKGGGYLELLVHSASKYYPTRKRPAMLVVAGGGYSGICEREGEPIASAYYGNGFNAFIMTYSVAPVCFPAQLVEGAMAIAYIRKNAEELGVDADMIAACGFSAGGHFSAMLATLYDNQAVKDALMKDAALCRPNAVVLGYPVITSGEYAHKDSFINLTGNNQGLFELTSLEKQVTKDSVPAFIWATADDDLVPSESSLLLAAAYKRAGVPFELHVYESGHHGLGLATPETATPFGRVLNSTVEDYVSPAVATWFSLSVTWLNNRGLKVHD